MPTQERLRELFDYQDGKLITKKGRRGIREGKVGGGLNGRYFYMCVDYRQCALHRLIWIWHHGFIPSDRFVDHIDHDCFNNKIDNLRLVTVTGNARNRSPNKLSKSGALGVVLRDGRWRASITIGTFDTREEAIAVRKSVEEFLGFHPNHGKEKTTPEDVAKAA